MRSTIDAAGRLVIPKPLRERLGLTARQAVEISERDGRIEIEPVATPMALLEDEGGPVAVPGESLPTLTDEVVRATLERSRR